jgi:AcrR family transcriptional regulator
MSLETSPPGVPRERADARRNRQLLLEAAASCVAEKGTSVAALDIAEHAGVSVATLYRRFTSKEALIEQVLLDLLDRLNAVAARALADRGAWDGLSGFIVAFARMNKDNHGLSEALGSQGTEALAASQRQLRVAIRDLTSRARLEGVLREDVTWQDLAFVPKAILLDRECIGLTAGEQEWERCLTLMLDGLRTPSPTPLPGSGPTASLAGAEEVNGGGV